MSNITQAYDRGLDAGRKYAPNLDTLIKEGFAFMYNQYPMLKGLGLDLAHEIVAFDNQRMASPPDPIKYPEARDVPDMVIQERKGFTDGAKAAGLAVTPLHIAYYYSWHFYYSRRINTRYVGLSPAKNECSAVYMADSAEGGPLYGRNWDVSRTPWAWSFIEPPRVGADGSKKMMMKGVSCSVFLDDEPQDLFPVDVFAIMPQDCKHVNDAVEFLTRYKDFWGPGNQFLADADHNSVAIEKANCKIGVRPSVNGVSAVGAVSFMIPHMREFKRERGLLSIKRRGWTTDNAPDWKYWQGADARYERILFLAEKLGKLGKAATLQDMANLMTDHDVPYPARVCIAGEGDIGTPEQQEWTLCSHSEVLEGPNRRILFYTVEGDKPCYETPPYLVPGEGVAIKDAWKTNTRPLPAVPKNTPRPRIHAEYPALRMMV
jgi:hypothetical protein